MASIISAGTTSGTSLNLSGDTSGVLQLASNGSTTAVTIDTSQNVGIGTASPGARLSLNVAGATDLYTRFTNGSFTSGFYVGLQAGNSALLAVNDNLPMAFQTNGTERMRITSGGLLQFNSGYGSVATAYGCRAWVNFNGTGTPSITGSANVSSITDNGTGDFTINFTTAMPDANYAITSSAFENVGSWAGGIFGSRSSFPPTTTAVRGSCVSYVGNYVDPNIVNVAIFR